MNSEIQTAAPAWHRQFWPWFLIALPAAAVIAGILTLVIAITHPVTLVKRDEHEALGPVLTIKPSDHQAQQ